MLSGIRRRHAGSSLLTGGAAVGGLVLAVGLTACGGEGDQGDSSGSSAAVRQVQGAYEKTTAAGTVTVSLEGRQPTPSGSPGQQGQQGQQSTIAGEAKLDFAENASSVTIDGSGRGGSETRIVKGVQYQKIPEQQRQQVPGNKPWIKIDMAEASKPQYGERATEVAEAPPVDPAGLLPYLRGVQTAKESGTADVRGTATRRYDVTVNLQKGTRGQNPQIEQQTAQLQQQLGKPTLDMRVWLDEQGRMRQLETTLPMGGQQGGAQNVTLTEYFYDFGDSMQIEPPAEDKTADVTQQVIQQQQMQQQPPQQQQPQQPQSSPS